MLGGFGVALAIGHPTLRPNGPDPAPRSTQRKNVCSLIPCRRQTSAVGDPASCSRSTPMICSSVSLLFFIVRLLVTDSHINCGSLGGACVDGPLMARP